MKAYPSKLVDRFRKAVCDPDGKVEYQVQRLPNSLQVHIATDLVKEFGVQPAAGEIGYEALRYALVDLRGLEDPDTGKPLELAHDTVKVRGETYKRVRIYSLDRLPPALLAEMMEAVGKMAEGVSLSAAERKDLGFTAASPVRKSSAKATRRRARTSARKADS